MSAAPVTTRSLSAVSALVFLSSAGPDVVQLPATDGQAALILDGRRGSECRRDWVALAGTQFAVGAEMTATASCPSELVVMAKGNALRFMPNPAWTHDPANPLEVSLLPRQPLRLHVVIPAGRSDVETWAQLSVSTASAMFKRNRTGLLATPTYKQAVAADNQIIGDGCSAVTALKSQGPAKGLYRKNSVNVYFVPAIDMNGWGRWMGYNCFQQTGNSPAAPEVIYISYWYSAATTLTHELGHALGLQGPVGHTNPGAQDGREDFPVTNLLYSFVSWEQAAAQNGLSLGQSYRINLDRLSWLNRPEAGPRPNKICGTNPVALGPCPVLKLDLP